MTSACLQSPIIVLTIMLVSLTGGCTPNSVDSELVSFRDSAGVEIVEARGARWSDATKWQVEPNPVLQIGVADGSPEFVFSNIRAVLLLDEDRLAVADRSSSQVRYFTRDGSFLRSFGRRGEGPGEFRRIRDMGQCGGDSLFVFDLDFKMVILTPTGHYSREARPYDLSSSRRRPYALECARNGFFIVLGREARSGPPKIGLYRAEAPTWILAPDHVVASETVETIPAARLVVTVELDTVLSSERIGFSNGDTGPHPFGRFTALAITESAIYLGSGGDYELQEYSLDGRLRRLVRWRGEDLSIRAKDIDTYRTERLANVSAAARPATERYLLDMPMLSTFPAYARIEVDPLGNIWVQSFRRPGQREQHWTVLAPDGGLLGSVLMPADFTVMDFGIDEVVGVSRDELGIERVRLHSIIKPGIQ